MPTIVSTDIWLASPEPITSVPYGGEKIKRLISNHPALVLAGSMGWCHSFWWTSLTPTTYATR